jgi:hypothetical protein
MSESGWTQSCLAGPCLECTCSLSGGYAFAESEFEHHDMLVMVDTWWFALVFLGKIPQGYLI